MFIKYDEEKLKQKVLNGNIENGRLLLCYCENKEGKKEYRLDRFFTHEKKPIDESLMGFLDGFQKDFKSEYKTLAYKYFEECTEVFNSLEFNKFTVEEYVLSGKKFKYFLQNDIKRKKYENYDLYTIFCDVTKILNALVYSTITFRILVCLSKDKNDMIVIQVKPKTETQLDDNDSILQITNQIFNLVNNQKFKNIFIEKINKMN